MTITQNYVDEFADVATIRDKRAFSARLATVIEREVARAMHPHHVEPASSPTSFRADQRWLPSATELQRGRALLLKTFGQPHLLTVPAFAALAGKSRQQVYKDIENHRLLALSIGARGCRIPDWQLDEVKKGLTQALFRRAIAVDAWTIYYALSQPSPALAGKAPVETVSVANANDVLRVVLEQLGVHD